MGLINTSFSLFSITILLLFSTTIVTANNITKAFEKYSNFSTMSDLFTQTKLTELINQYQTITVLAVDNKAITTIMNKSAIELKNILMTHVILDYYDELKLNALDEKSIMLTTLYQTTGLGVQMNGFINCTKSKEKHVYFGSGVKDSPIDAEYIATIFHNPFNLSLIQISKPIVAPGLSFAVYPSPPPPSPLAPAPAPSPMDAPMSPSPAPAPGSPENINDTSYTIVPITTPATEAPEDDDSPAPAPSADNEKIEAADKAGPSSSSACKAGLSIVIVFLLAFF